MLLHAFGQFSPNCILINNIFSEFTIKILFKNSTLCEFCISFVNVIFIIFIIRIYQIYNKIPAGSMSTQSITSLPPQLEMTARSIPLLAKRKNDILKTSGNVNQKTGNSVRKSNLDIVRRPTTNSFPSAMTTNYLDAKQTHHTLFKLSETSLRITENQPVNLRIMLHAADQLSSARPRKVKTK